MALVDCAYDPSPEVYISVQKYWNALPQRSRSSPLEGAVWGIFGTGFKAETKTKRERSSRLLPKRTETTWIVTKIDPAETKIDILTSKESLDHIAGPSLKLSKVLVTDLSIFQAEIHAIEIIVYLSGLIWKSAHESIDYNGIADKYHHNERAIYLLSRVDDFRILHIPLLTLIWHPLPVRALPVRRH